MAWASRLPWSEFVEFCEASVGERRREARVRGLTRFVASCRARAANTSLYPVARLLLPALDKDRGSYRIKETLLAALYTSFLQLGPTSKDALLLKNFRAPKSNPGDTGDFAAVLYTVMKDRGYQATSLTCAEVNTTLDTIVHRSEGAEGRREVEATLKRMFMAMSPVQQKWFVRVLLKEVRVGVGQAAVLAALHPDAAALLDVQASLATVCAKLKDPGLRLHEVEVELGQAFRPQLADRVAIPRLEKLFGGRKFAIETKYDGERCQVHLLEDGGMACFSRCQARGPETRGPETRGPGSPVLRP